MRAFSNSDIGQMVSKDSGPIKFCTHQNYQYLCGVFYTCTGCHSLLEMAGRVSKVKEVGTLLEFVKSSREAMNKGNYEDALEYVSKQTGIEVERLLMLVR